MSTNVPFHVPGLRRSGIRFPNSPIHTADEVYNHCVRGAYWSLLLAKKLPEFSSLSSSTSSSERSHFDLETVVLASILHDIGWATTPELLSSDKRFEVDGRTQVVWDAIALHTTASIALHHPAPEVSLAHLGVMADFLGPLFPPGDGAVITEDEYRVMLVRFPLAGLSTDGVKEIMYGLCRNKPETTFDNIVGGFGLAFGLDGKGKGRDEYKRAKEQQDPVNTLLPALDYLASLLREA
ncbi:hypothetical protein GGR52DRAFT_582582 [Hypoxylon sp. FL1284]|nr:hypothetical protein GGR52DRAFT_582582 [Hypoxylon sp. FL1284]